MVEKEALAEDLAFLVYSKPHEKSFPGTRVCTQTHIHTKINAKE